jgi:hypothetical protein
VKLSPRWTNVDHTLENPGEYDIYVEQGRSTYTVSHFVFHRGILISLIPLDGYNEMRCFLEECENFDNGERWNNIEYVYFQLLKKLNTSCYLYYYTDESWMDDQTFDTYEAQLIQIENDYPELVSEYSPTQRATRNFNQEQLYQFNQYLKSMGM